MTSVASKVPFNDLCKVCEKVSTKQGKANKQKILNDFITAWRDYHNKLHKDDTNTDDSFFPAMRLLLPQFEKERSAYGIKEFTLAKLYIEILCLNKESKDALKLLNYRSPTSAKNDAGDFATVAYFVLKNRCPEKGTLTIEDVNNCLDAIAVNNAAKKKDIVKKNILHLLKNTSALEQKWLIRMIMKSLKFGVSEQTVLSLFHPDAKDLYDVSNSLSKVCEMLRDPNVRLHEIAISLFSPFRPMLAETANPDKIEKILNNTKFYVETKFDGERMQLHMDKNKYMYFSRNGNDFTSSFGSNCFEGPLTKYISGCFSRNVKNCILDGEMVGYNTAANCIGSKGENFDVKSLKDGDDYHPCFCVFDILLYNDTVLTNKPLRERLLSLEGLFTPIEGRLHLAARKDIESKQDAIDALNNAIDNREEGVVVKNPDSLYKPNTRKGGWYKIKPDYVDNLVEQLDLLIIGGYFGEGRRRGLISHFLLGVAETPSKLENHPTKFHSFCRVGSGYSLQELYDLCLKLNSHWVPYDRRNPPPNILIGSGHKERPDIWIEPSNSCIVQIKAAEITKSDKFMTGISLRFPRVEKVRYDKEWHECLTTTELDEIYKQSQGKLASRYNPSDSDNSGPSPKKRIITKLERPVALASHFKGVNPSTVKKVLEIFHGKEMYVINTPPEHSKQNLEKLILENGGTIVQNPGPNTFCVLAYKLALRVQNIINAKKYDVVKTDWLLHSVNEKLCLPWTPADMWYSSPSTAEVFALDYDKYGDHYVNPITEDELKRIFQEMKDVRDQKNLEIAELEAEYFPNSSLLGLFRLYKVYFDRYENVNDVSTVIKDNYLEICEQVYKFHGGVVHLVINEETTHVVVHSSDTSRVTKFQQLNRSRSKKFHLVTEEWVKRSIENGTISTEMYFQPN